MANRAAGFVIVVALASGPAFPGEPAVRGPESVSEWYEAGQRFVRESRGLRPNAQTAKRVILFVGDGMGISTVTAARILQGQSNGKPGEENRLFFETFPHVALSKTYSWDQQSADSAPTMTAMVTGYKSREGMISVDHTTARGECSAQVIARNSLPTILELAAERGRSTGVVSTARLTHATPAANYSHTAMRDWEDDSSLPPGCGAKDIARQLIEPSHEVMSSLRVAMGGGRINFLPKKTGVAGSDPEYPDIQGRRNDGRDLTAEWLKTRGPNARYVWDKGGFDRADPRGVEYLLGLFEPSHMHYEADRTADPAGEPSLTEMTEKAIRILEKDESGYYLQVEAGRIDYAHHAGNARRALLDTIELSNAVRKAYEMTDPRDTLIIVTADHSHTLTIGGYPHRGNPILGLVSGVPSVDGDPVKLDLDRLGLPFTTLGYANGPGWRDAIATGKKRPELSAAGVADPEFRQEAAVPLESETHGGEDVAVYASGPMSFLVHGSMEQNWIFHVMKAAFGF